MIIGSQGNFDEKQGIGYDSFKNKNGKTILVRTSHKNTSQRVFQQEVKLFVKNFVNLRDKWIKIFHLFKK